MGEINLNNLKERIDEFMNDMVDFKTYCTLNVLPENEESRATWKRERNIYNLFWELILEQN